MASLMLPSNVLSVQVNQENFQFQTTAELEPLIGSLGQERALHALQIAAEMDSSDYNVFVIGETGLGEHEVVRNFLEYQTARRVVSGDWIYVYNFINPDQPAAIMLPPGKARGFQRQMAQFIDDLRTTIPSLYESERYRNRRDSLIKEFKDLQDRAISDLQDRAKKLNVYLLNLRGNLIFAQGDKSGNLIDDEALSKMPEEEQKEISTRLFRFNEELLSVVSQFPILERQLRNNLKEFSRGMIAIEVETLSKELRENYRDHLKIKNYLAELTKDIIENARYFRRAQEEQVEMFERFLSPLKRYQINIMIEQSTSSSGPVIYEDNPTFMNLVGQIEHVSHMGALVTDFSLIKAGALHRASGGFLMLDANKLLTSAYSWEGLKRSLKAQRISIESLGQVYSLISTVSVRPEAIPLNCRILVFGDRETYQLLTRFDPEFATLFKIVTEFNNVMKRTEQNEFYFMRFIAMEIKRKEMRPLELSGAVQVLKYAIRWAEDTDRISLDIEKIVNLLKEANYFANQSRETTISGEIVRTAMDAQRKRLSMTYEKILDEMVRGTVLVDVVGWVVGQVNGLSIFEVGNLLFGRVNRITSAVSMGEGHVIDIERETKLGGSIHSKGVLILAGFLRSFYASDVPLAISASLVFEQSYGAVEGDSASLAELCALLSSLSQFSVRQSFAVTGSINQHGEVQAVGAINEKIEGFFDLCLQRGLSSEQGVIIPRANIKHLALREDIVSAVEKNLFTIYAVDSVHDCMQLLTGMPSPAITDKIESRLRGYSAQIQKMRSPSLRQAPSNLEIREMNAAQK